MTLKKYTLFFFTLLIGAALFAQEGKKDVNKLSKNEVLEMTIEELSFYDLEELTKLMDIVGASSLDELYELLLNKDVTSASKSEESVFDSPLSTTVLSYEEILQSGATSIPEALRLVPGMIVREKTNGNYDVHIRGNDNLPAKNMVLYSENMNTLVMINGRPVFNYSHGGTLWETLPVSFEDIDRIEVVRGPSGALYGPNALSGVINIITKEIDDQSPLFSGNFQGGSLNTFVGDLGFRKQLNDLISVGLTGNYEIRDREREELLIYNGEDVDGNLLYTLDENPVGSGYYSTDEIGRMYKADKQIWPPYYVNDEIYDVNTSYPNPDRASQRVGINGYVNISPNEDAYINIMGGYQNSEVITSTMGDVPSPYSTKVAETGYIDVRAKVKNFSLQGNYNAGTIDYMTGNEGFELDNSQFNIFAEYDIKLNNIGIRPGINYQSVSYDDTEHIAQIGNGYLNKKQTINILSGSARIDYQPINNLRFIAALRAEKYNHPEDIYASWQFVGSYKLNDNHMFRAVYSRSNQSAFLVNTYSNYTWNIVNRPYPRVMQFDGDLNHKLKTTDMIEVGYRTRPSKNIIVDIEGFYNISKDFGALMPSYTSLAIYNPEDVLNGYQTALLNGADATTALMSGLSSAVILPDSINIAYQNLDLKSKQYGASINIDWVISEKLIAKAHFTWQKTKLDNYLAYSRDEIIAYQASMASSDLNVIGANTAAGLTDVGMAIAIGLEPDNLFVAESAAQPTDLKDDYEHKSTPSYWGSISLSYKPVKKLNIFVQSYYYGKQTFENQYYDVDIDAKALVNAKINYQLNNKLSVYFNGRNILNNKTREFAFMDETPAMYLLGTNFKF